MFSAVIGKIGVTELLVILLIVLVVFGPTQLPKLSKTLEKLSAASRRAWKTSLVRTIRKNPKQKKKTTLTDRGGPYGREDEKESAWKY